MHIVNIINSILQAMVEDQDCELQSWQYNDLSTANVRLDNKKPSPTAVFLQISDWTMGVNAINVRESADINISFLEKEGKMDAGGIEQDGIIDRMKWLAIDFVKRLRNVKSLEIEDDEIKIKSVFLRSDSNRSGVNIQLSLKERQGECLDGGSYDPVLTISTNGAYSVGGYTQIIVDIPECPVCPECPECPELPYLTFRANTPGSTVGMTHYGTNQTSTQPVMYISTDQVNWSQWDFSTVTLANAGDELYMYGRNLSGIGHSSGNYSNFTMTGSIAVEGGISSLINEGTDDISGLDYCFRSLFENCEPLTQAPSLDISHLSHGCYMQMFRNCSSLTTAPALPAMTMEQSCYYGMFSECTSLTSAPELPATTLAQGCYQRMFFRCYALTAAPALPARTMARECYCQMFMQCTALTAAPELPARTLAVRCYDSMFNGCTSLATAPELPATTMEERCYLAMFNECTSLTQAPALPSKRLNSYCYSSMFAGCTSLAQAPALPATQLNQYCYNSMFKGCTALTAAPELPAGLVGPGTLELDCYKQMFDGCTALQYVKVGATSWYSQYTMNWMRNVSQTGTFEKLTATDIPTDSPDGIPSGWTIINYQA